MEAFIDGWYRLERGTTVVVHVGDSIEEVIRDMETLGRFEDFFKVVMDRLARDLGFESMVEYLIGSAEIVHSTVPNAFGDKFFHQFKHNEILYALECALENGESLCDDKGIIYVLAECEEDLEV